MGLIDRLTGRGSVAPAIVERASPVPAVAPKAPAAAPTVSGWRNAPRIAASYMRGGRGSVFTNWLPSRRAEHAERAIAWDDASARVAETLHNSGWLAGAVEQAIANTVGAAGVRYRPAPEHDEFGMTTEQARQWSKTVGRRWELYSETAHECDLAALRTVPMMQAAALELWFGTGEILAEIVYKRRSWGQWGTKVRLMHPSRLSRATDASRRIINGVQIDADGMPTGYLLRKGAMDRATFTEDVLVPARDRYGRPRIIHVFNGPPETYRGITPLAPALQALRQFDQLSDATLTAAVIQTLFAASFTSDQPVDEALEAMLTPKEQAEMRAAGISPLEAYVDIVTGFAQGADVDIGMAGRIIRPLPGEKLEFHSPKTPAPGYADFASDLKREFARCLGLLYESATGDYQGATYASLGRGLAEIYEVTKMRRASVLVPFMKPLVEAFLEEEIERGTVPFPGRVAGFLRHRSAACRAIYAGSARPIAEELKLSKSHQTWVSMGAMSLTHVCRELGLDYEDVVADLEAETALRKLYNVADPTPVGMAAAGAALPPPGTEPDEPEDDDAE